MAISDPFDPNAKIGNCNCGKHSSQEEHDANEIESLSRRVVQTAVMKSLFPKDVMRRRFLSAVGVSTAWAAISSMIPFEVLAAMTQDKGPLEKKDLNIGFLPITCATPIIYAGAADYYKQEGLNVTLQKTAGWAIVREKVIAKEFDASHMLSPMPLAISMGAGSNAEPMVMPVMENINGNAITLAMKHIDNRDPKNWKGMKFGIPFDFSMHNFILRYYLAAYGIDPDKDVQLRVMAPPDMVANLKSGNLDGFIVAEPFNQRAVYENVGFIHALTSEIWDNHPCCAFAATENFVRQSPNSFSAMVRAIMRATQFAHKAENRKAVAELIATPNYLNQPVTVVEQVLTGRFADGLGKIRDLPNRIDFDPFPWHSMAVWILTQMKRWGYVKGDIRYTDIAERVFLATDAKKRMAELGFDVPKDTYRKHVILGNEFDPRKPDDYLKGFGVKL